MKQAEENSNESDIGYIIKTTGYLKSIEDIEKISIKTEKATPIE